MEFRITFILLALISSSFCSLSFGSLSDVTLESKPVEPEPPVVTGNSTTAPTTTTKASSVAPETTTASPKPTETTTVPPKTTQTTTLAPKTTETTTVAPKTTETTTVAPKTTETTTVTPEPTTSTVKPTPDPKTTTEPPKTTTVKPTDAPTTSTSAPVTTTAAPQPAKAGVWFVEKNNVTCVVAKMLIDVNVTYATNNGTKHAIVVSLAGTNATAVNGTCGNHTQSIQVPLVGGHILALNFVSNDTSKHYAVGDIQLLVNVTALPDLKDNVTELVYELKSPLFDTALSKSYKCNTLQSKNLTTAANWTAVLTVKDTQLEAFRQDAIVKFGDAEDCETADTPDIVPIAVGVSLGVMILIVLVAYLVGRRRPLNSGYVSM